MCVVLGITCDPLMENKHSRCVVRHSKLVAFPFIPRSVSVADNLRFTVLDDLPSPFLSAFIRSLEFPFGRIHPESIVDNISSQFLI